MKAAAAIVLGIIFVFEIPRGFWEDCKEKGVVMIEICCGSYEDALAAWKEAQSGSN